MVAKNFQPLVQQLLGIEGGVADRPLKDDPGGLTNRGVTQAVYDPWRSLQGLPAKSVREITTAEVVAIARTNYWDPVQGDRLPAGIDFAAFDFAFNSGPSQAVKELQRVLGCAPDGAVGLATLEALAVADRAATINAYCDRRMAFMKRLKNWKANADGWTARVAHVRAQSLALAAGDAPTPPSSFLATEPLAKAPPPPQKPVSRSKRLWLAFVGLLAGLGQWVTDHINALIGWVSNHLPIVGDYAGKLQQMVMPQAGNSAVLAKLSGFLAVVTVGAGAAVMILQAKAHKDGAP